MKKNILILLLLFCGIALQAQPILRKAEYSLGIQGGAMASMVNFNPTVEQTALDPYLGAIAGAVFRYNGHKYCGLQVELNWMEKGWKEAGTGYMRRMDYLQLPFLAHIYFGKQYRGFFNIGPQIGYMLSDKAISTTADSEIIEQHLSIQNRFDWGLAASVGFVARTIAGNWQIEARFNYSLGSIFNNRPTDYFSASQPMNLSLTAAWLWEWK